MVYFIKANAEQVFTYFNLKMLLSLASSVATQKTVADDIFRTPFLGNVSDLNHHLQIWRDPEAVANDYCQGNMAATNLFLIFGIQPFKKPDESNDYYTSQFVSVGFAFVDDDKSLCGLSFYYRKDNPQQWLLGLVKGTNLIANQRQLYILTTEPPLSPLGLDFGTSIIKEIDKSDYLLSETIFPYFSSLVIQSLLSALLTRAEQIHPQAEIIKICAPVISNRPPTEFLRDSDKLLTMFCTQSDELFNNKALQHLINKQVTNLRPAQVLVCLNNESLLHQTICSLDNTNDLQMIIKLDTLGLLSRGQALVADRNFAKLLDELMIDQINHPFLQQALTNDTHTQLLRFINQSGLIKEFLTVLRNPTFEEWYKIAWLEKAASQAEAEANLFAHAVMSYLLLRTNHFSTETQTIRFYQQLCLAECLPRVYEPLDLAKYLATCDEKTLAENIETIQNFFQSFLSQLSVNTSESSTHSFSAKLLKTHGRAYLADTQLYHSFEDIFTTCDNEAKISASLTLIKQDFKSTHLKKIIVNPFLVRGINHLSLLGLHTRIKPLLKDYNVCSMLGIIYPWQTQIAQIALILLERQLFDINKTEWFLTYFTENSQLASLLVDLHHYGYPASDLQKIMLTPAYHPLFNLLNRFRLKIDLDQVTSVMIQLFELIQEKIEILKYHPVVQQYISTVLPQLLAQEMSPHFLSLAAVLPDNFSGKMLPEQQLCFEMKQIIEDYLFLTIELKKREVNIAQLMMPPEVIIKLAVDCFVTEDIALRTLLYQQVINLFFILKKDTFIDEKKMMKAMQALKIAFHQQDKLEDSEQNYLALFIMHPELAKAVIKLAHHAPVNSLFKFSSALQEHILNRLTLFDTFVNLDPSAYEMLLNRQSEGKDFRNLLNWIKKASTQLQLRLINEMILSIRTRSDQGLDNILAACTTEPEHELGKQIVSRLKLINHFRLLNVDEDLIESLTSSRSPETQKLIDSALEIEARCQSIRERLEKESPSKFQDYQQPERIYRQTIYRLMYDYLVLHRITKDQFAQGIEQAQTPLLQVADTDRHPWLRQSMLVLSNTLGLLMLWIPNVVNKWYNGSDLFFYRHTTSGQDIRFIANDVLAPLSKTP